jgi:hypothetical protein
VVALDVVVIVIVALLAVLVAGLLRSHAEVLRAMHQMGVDLGPSSPTGVTSPVAFTTRPTPRRPDATALVDLTGSTPTGEAVHVAVGEVRHDTVIAFLTSGCSTCREFWEAFRTSPPDVPGGARLVVVTRGSEAESPGTLARLAGDRLPVVMSTEVWDHYDVPVAPYFIYVSGAASRIVGEGTATTWEQVRQLVTNAVNDGTTTPRGTPGADLSGRWQKAQADARRELRIDAALRAAGLVPGDPRLHPATINDGPADPCAAS